MVGLGGIYVELFKDVALSPCPVTKEEAGEMLKSLKCYKLLAGYRTGQRLDVEALKELIANVSNYAVTHSAYLAELDVNPVYVYPEGEGCCAVDCLAYTYEEEGD